MLGKCCHAWTSQPTAQSSTLLSRCVMASRLPSGCPAAPMCSATPHTSTACQIAVESVHQVTICDLVHALLQVPPPMSALSTMPQLRSANTDKGLKLVRL